MDLDEARATLETPSPRRSVLVKLCRELIAEVEDLRVQVSDWEDKCDNLQEDLDYKARHDSGSDECSNMSSDSDSDSYFGPCSDLIHCREYAKNLTHTSEQLEDQLEKIKVMLQVTLGLTRTDFSKGMVHEPLDMFEPERRIAQEVVDELSGIRVQEGRCVRVGRPIKEEKKNKGNKKNKGKRKSK